MDMENAEDLELLLQTSVAKEALVDIYKSRDRLMAIANDICSARIWTDAGDTASEMAMLFLLKQMEHMVGVTQLANANCHRDTVVLARTMVEGAARLNWALLDAPERTDLWYWFSIIDEWRTLQANVERGMPYDSEHLARVGEAMEKHGLKYIRDRLLKELDREKSEGKAFLYPKDPWAYEWTKFSAIDMIKLIDDGGSLEDFYRRSSQWVHWVSPPMFRALKEDHHSRMFDRESWTELAGAFVASVTGLALVIQLVARRLDLPWGNEIDTIRNELRDALRKRALPITLDFGG